MQIILEKIFGSIFNKAPQALSQEEKCVAVGQEEERRLKSVTEAYPELAPGLATQVEQMLRDKDFAVKSEPVQVSEVTPGNVAHIWGAVATATCLKHPDRAR